MHPRLMLRLPRPSRTTEHSELQIPPLVQPRGHSDKGTYQSPQPSHGSPPHTLYVRSFGYGVSTTGPLHRENHKLPEGAVQAKVLKCSGLACKDQRNGPAFSHHSEVRLLQATTTQIGHPQR